ncbi:MAG: hypothetical protein QNJ32_20135 [Xenococcaceae cyanobacterium MO_167.B27]|nr:hypothetical protein [Xenococcaceae cyanobacterium MO_167.B27]
MWRYLVENLKPKHTQKISLLFNEQRLTYSEVIELWQNNSDFGLFFSYLLASATFSAYFWETPPITLSTLHREFEFVLIDSPQLARVSPNSSAFSSHFLSASPGQDIISFPNLRNDALLVVPCPVGDISIYPHIASFVRNAPQSQNQALWQTLGKSIEQRLNDQPLWVSTSGLGVYWLHIRLDSYPKYYCFKPFKIY